MEPAPSSSLLQLIDALNQCVEPEHHTRLISEALLKAGLPNVPAERDAFRAFVTSSLEPTVSDLLGASVASELTWTLMRITSVRAPPSKSPASSKSGRFSTAEYTEDVFALGADVLFMGEEGPLFDELRIHLEARGYRVDRADDGLDQVNRDHPPRVLVANIEVSEGVRYAERLRKDLGARAPSLVVLTDQAEPPAPPKGVDSIVSTGAVAPIVTAVLKILGPLED